MPPSGIPVAVGGALCQRLGEGNGSQQGQADASNSELNLGIFASNRR
jgi:hypothetical protein